jgi:hypothetical protein
LADQKGCLANQETCRVSNDDQSVSRECYLAIHLKLIWFSEEIPPEMNKSTAYCMSQYQKLASVLREYILADIVLQDL